MLNSVSCDEKGGAGGGRGVTPSPDLEAILFLSGYPLWLWNKGTQHKEEGKINCTTVNLILCLVLPA